MALTETGNLTVQGNLRVAGTMPEIARSGMEQNAVQKYSLDLTQARVHDNLVSALPSTSANDDLTVAGNTFGTNTPTLETSDLKSAGATTRYARFIFVLPPEYDAGQTVQITTHAGLKDNAADTTATVDIECYLSDNEGSLGSDLCTTAAQDINSTTLATDTFTITSGALVVGSVLDIRVALAINDGAGASPVTGQIGNIAVLLDIRG